VTPEGRSLPPDAGSELRLYSRPEPRTDGGVPQATGPDTCDHDHSDMALYGAQQGG